MASPKAEWRSATHASQSFTRMDSPRSTYPARNRGSTLQNRTNADSTMSRITDSPLDEKAQQSDIFEKSSLISGEEGSIKDVSEIDSPEIPDGFDELPIELISLIDRFIESLSAKVHNTPPSIEKLSEIFQDFYLKAESHIATHISALSTRQSRGASPAASISSKTSITGRDGKKLQTSSSRDNLGSPGGAAEMLTPQEVSDRRKARRLLDRKGVALEEAVERRVCERVYSRIWRHRSTLDEVRDEKLRSRTAALALVGIGLRDLGITLDSSSNESDIEEGIAKAREGLLRMNDAARYPLGKLQQLAAAHKNIVDLLTTIHHSSSSADEILPTLIYTLITTPPEGINIISNLHFIQRFRASNKVDGEAAYCLVNLEAAITFLETVDLASLRSDEPLEGPPKSTSRPSTPRDDVRPDWIPGMPTSATLPSPSATSVTAIPKEPTSHPLQSPHMFKAAMPVSPSHNRRLSNLLETPTSALGAASDAVRNSADQGIKTIGNTLDSSFKLLFGRLREQNLAGDNVSGGGTIIVPKTLDDARKLVEPKPADEEDAILSPDMIKPPPDDTILSAIAGRRPRDQSVDSAHSSASGSGRKATFTPTTSQPRDAPLSSSPSNHADPLYMGNAAVESMRSLGNSLNPLKGFGGMNVMRGFGRSASSSTSTPTLATAASGEKVERETPGSVSPTKSGSEAQTLSRKLQPPVQRFVDASSAEELRVGDVGELLRDYQRLAGVLERLGAF